MKLYDASGLLKIFNDVCDAVADDFENQIEAGLKEGVGFPPMLSRLVLHDVIDHIDDWWAIETIAGTFEKLYEMHLKNISEDEILELREVGFNELADWAGDDEKRFSFLNALMEMDATDPQQKALNKYLPHSVGSYAPPALGFLSGYKKLVERCGGDINLDVVIELNPNTERFDQKNSYKIALLFTPKNEFHGQSLMGIARRNSTLKKRLN